MSERALGARVALALVRDDVGAEDVGPIVGAGATAFDVAAADGVAAGEGVDSAELFVEVLEHATNVSATAKAANRFVPSPSRPRQRPTSKCKIGCPIVTPSA